MNKQIWLAIAASAMCGGIVGAVLTGATESQASPAAIAAAVQRVQDTQAERSLQSAVTQLTAINRSLSGNFATPLGDLEQDLMWICRNTESPGVVADCVGP